MDLIVVLIGIFLMNDDAGHFFVFLFSIHLSCKVLVWPNFQPWVLFLFLILLSFVSSSYIHQKWETETQSFYGLERTTREKRLPPGDLSKKKPELTIRWRRPGVDLVLNTRKP